MAIDAICEVGLNNGTIYDQIIKLDQFKRQIWTEKDYICIMFHYVNIRKQ